MAVCASLAKLADDGVFFLSARTAADALRLTHPMLAYRLLAKLVAAGRLQRVSIGEYAGRRASFFKLTCKTTSETAP